MSRYVITDDHPEPIEIDRTVARAARMTDHLLGGTGNFTVDRETAENIWTVLPGGVDSARRGIRANRAFVAAAVRYLAGELGLRQFLDIGTGIPNADNLHAAAQEIAPDSRIVHVDDDPVVLAHAHELLRGTAEGATAYVHADRREPRTVVRQAALTLDFTRPVAVTLDGVLHYILDREEANGVVTQLLDAVPEGSYLVVSHLASDVHAAEMAELVRRHDQPHVAETLVPRNHAEVCRFFEDVELIQPGVVRLDRWAGAGRRTLTSGDQPEIPIYVGIGRKRRFAFERG